MRRLLAIGLAGLALVVAVPLVRWLKSGVTIPANHGSADAEMPPMSLITMPSHSVTPSRASAVASAVPATTMKSTFQSTPS